MTFVLGMILGGDSHGRIPGRQQNQGTAWDLGWLVCLL